MGVLTGPATGILVFVTKGSAARRRFEQTFDVRSKIAILNRVKKPTTLGIDHAHRLIEKRANLFVTVAGEHGKVRKGKRKSAKKGVQASKFRSRRIRGMPPADDISISSTILLPLSHS